MKLKGRSILVICLLVFTAYAVYDYYKDKNKAEKDALASRLMTLNFEHVDQIELQKGDQKIQLKRTVDGWEMLSPVKDLADNTAADDFVKNAYTEKIIEVAAEGPDVSWQVYGLHQPLGKVTFTEASGAKNVFTISEKRNFEENTFARRDEEDRVIVVNSVWQSRLEKPFSDFRDMRVLRAKIASVDEVKLKNLNGLIDIKRVDGKWIDSKNKDTVLDQNKVREFLSTIADAKGSEFMEGKLKTPSLKNLMNLDLVMDGKKWNAQVGQAKDFLIYAKLSEPAREMRLAAGALDKLLKMTMADLHPSQEAKPETKEKN